MAGPGLLLRGIRLGRRLDLQAMSDTLGTTSRHLEQVEAGAAFPAAGERRSWATALGFADLTAFDAHWRPGPDAAWDAATAPGRDGWVTVVNKAPAGPPTDYEEHGVDTRTGFEYVARPTGAAGEGRLFAVVIVGDSMRPTYRPGDLVVFRPVDPEAVADGTSPVVDGSPVFVRFTVERDHGCTVKSLWRRTDGRFDLRPENPAHRTVVVGPWEVARLAVAVERRAAYCRVDAPPRRVTDEHAQAFPDEP
jgi:SOS-response transcriptional repressor LexA